MASCTLQAAGPKPTHPGSTPLQMEAILQECQCIGSRIERIEKSGRCLHNQGTRRSHTLKAVPSRSSGRPHRTLAVERS